MTVGLGASGSLRNLRVPYFVKPERVEDARAVPCASEEIIPRGAQQFRVEIRESRGIFGEKGGLDRVAERAFEPVGERDGARVLYSLWLYEIWNAKISQ